MKLISNTPWRKAVSVEAQQGYRLRVLMEDDEVLNLDLNPLITRREVFWRLKNFKYFQKVAIDPLGGLCWPGGEDIAPGKIPYYALGTEHDAPCLPC
jgi:hypothetical protein